jgi:hypothetical protein
VRRGTASQPVFTSYKLLEIERNALSHQSQPAEIIVFSIPFA